jgi:cytochrome c553
MVGSIVRDIREFGEGWVGRWWSVQLVNQESEAWPLAPRRCISARLPAAAFVLSLFLPLAVPAVPLSQQELDAVKRSSPNLDRGAEVFQTCAICHGHDGGGTPDGQVPSIAGQHASVLRKQLVDYRHDRRRDLRMQSVTDRHDLPTPQSIADVTAYVSNLERTAPIGTGDGRLVQQGARVYARQCGRCHGSEGEGSGPNTVPRLAGQHYEYLRRQVHEAIEGHRPSFSAGHIRLLARLDEEDVQAVSDYLSRLGGEQTRTEPQPAKR